MNQTIKNLQQQIKAEEEKIKNCSHDFEQPIYDPETIKEAYGYRLVGQGSDTWTEPQGYRDVPKARWTRKCKKCGYEQHTYEQKAIIKDYEPKF